MNKMYTDDGQHIPLDLTTSKNDDVVSIQPFVTPNDVPTVVLYIRLDKCFETTLNGHPAIALFLGEKDGKSNAPWEVGHQLQEAWAQAEKLAIRGS